jgi:flagellar biosynthesis anti-sigma factor FlgM
MENKEVLVDKLQISAQPKETKKINDVLQTVPEVSPDRIAELKKLVQEDRYQVDWEDLADKMIEQMIIDLIK